MSKIIKRSVVIDGRKTSVSLEDEFWQELCRIAGDEGMFKNEIVAKIASKKGRRGSGGNLSSALRLYVLERAMERI